MYGFRFYFTPLAGVLFAFPSRYFCTIGSYGVFSLGSWSTQIPTGFLVSRRTQVPHKRVLIMSCTGISPSLSGLPKPFHYNEDFLLFGSRPRSGAHAALQPHINVVWALPISLAATFGISGGSLLFLISFPGLLRWFSSPSVASLPYFIQVQDIGISSNGLPHSAIQGSQDMCSFPWLFAAYHGLLRLVAPRHPPYTSIRLTILSFLLILGHKSLIALLFFRQAPVLTTDLKTNNNASPKKNSIFFLRFTFPSLMYVKDHRIAFAILRFFQRACFVRSSSWA